MSIDRPDRFIFDHEGGITEIAPTSLLIFIDDTGHESLNDPRVPYFGFGGCVIPASHYLRCVHIPWKEVEKHFPVEMLPLHAADLKPPDIKPELKYITAFFEEGLFGRFAGVISNEAINETEENIFHVMAAQTYNRASKIASALNFDFDRVDMIFEHSQRTDKIMRDFFARYDFIKNGEKLPVQRWLMSKSKELLSGLIVADFIAHTAGSSVRSRLEGKRSKENERHDFKAVFQPANKNLAEFLEITKIETT